MNYVLRRGSPTQPDPIGLRGGLNLYGYGDGDALNNTDPFGLCVLWIKWCPPRDAHYSRNSRNRTVPIATVLAEGSDWSKSNWLESSFHRQGEGNSGNRKFTHADGSELVFNEVDALVTDDLNMGTFNFVVPSSWRNPLLAVLTRVGHGAVDVLPYALWGNTPNDPSNLWDRTLGAPGQNTWREVNAWLDGARAQGVPVRVTR